MCTRIFFNKNKSQQKLPPRNSGFFLEYRVKNFNLNNALKCITVLEIYHRKSDLLIFAEEMMISKYRKRKLERKPYLSLIEKSCFFYWNKLFITLIPNLFSISLQTKRNPFKTLLAEFNRRAAGHLGYVPITKKFLQRKGKFKLYIFNLILFFELN